MDRSADSAGQERDGDLPKHGGSARLYQALQPVDFAVGPAFLHNIEGRQAMKRNEWKPVAMEFASGP